MAAVDSSVIIHLARIGKLSLLRDCLRNIRITKSIEMEIIKEGKAGAEEIRKAIGSWISVEKITSQEKSDILSAADAELIKLAEAKKDFILTNDENIILFAKARGIETMWLTSFILLCLKKRVMDNKEAKLILHDLVKHGCYIRTDVYAALLVLIEEM